MFQEFGPVKLHWFYEHHTLRLRKTTKLQMCTRGISTLQFLFSLFYLDNIKQWLILMGLNQRFTGLQFNESLFSFKRLLKICKKLHYHSDICCYTHFAIPSCFGMPK